MKDLCSTHVSELVAGARKPRPGRRKGVVAKSGAASSGAKKSGAKKSGARKTTASGKRRGRPPKVKPAV